MIVNWQVDGLVALVRAAYPDWAGFDDGAFVADELAYKRATIAKARQSLSEQELGQLLAHWQYDELLGRLERLGRDNNLLWNRMPQKGDMAILFRPELNKAEFCLQLNNLLYGKQPSPTRLEAFTHYTVQHGLPSKWTFATYFLFITRPETEFFVKPAVVHWFLKFMGLPDVLDRQPTAESYQLLLKQLAALKEALGGYRPGDMVDIQSLLWVCKQQSEKRTGRLNLRGQVELNVPDNESSYEINQTNTFIRESTEEEEAMFSPLPETNLNPLVTLAEIAQETGYEEAELVRWVRAIERKGQIVLYGPPGTGKTYMGQWLARHLVGGGQGLIELVQFHPGYGYEDFVQGIRPVTTPNGQLRYELRPGRLLTFCQAVSNRPGKSLLIIDEINRANLSRVFGELMYLLEYRGRQIPLAGGGNFQLPANLYLIATMNTTDRSIALVDHALRRRFAFIHLPPHYQSLRHYHQRQKSDFPIEKLITLLQELNQQIDDPHYVVGLSFFMRLDLADQLADIWQMEIEPYLEELFFDQPERLAAFRWEKVKRFWE